MLIAAIALLPALTGCSRSDAGLGRITVTGSTTILPIAEVSSESFHDANPDVKVLVSGVGSSAGIESVSKGSSDIGASSRDLKENEKALGLVDTPIALDAIAIVVNKDNPVDSLTTDQVKRIFKGEITNWSEVGGPDLHIGLVNRDEASGTREAFLKIVLGGEPFDPTAAVLPGTGQVRAVVANSKGAIGYISYGFVDESVKAVAVDGVAPTVETAADGSYPIRRILHFFTKGAPSALAKRYIDYVLSDEIQSNVVRDAGFIPVNAGKKTNTEESP